MQNRSSDEISSQVILKFFSSYFFQILKIVWGDNSFRRQREDCKLLHFFIRLPLDARILFLLVKSAFFWTRNLNRYLVFYKKSQTNLFRFTVWLVKKQNCIVTSKNSGKLSLMKCKIRKNCKKRINNSQFTLQCQPYIFFQVNES